MSLDHIRGEIEILVRDCTTHEIVDRITETNVVTDQATMYYFWFQNGSFYAGSGSTTYIVIGNSKKIPLNSIYAANSYPISWYATGAIPAGTTSPTWGEPSAPYSWYGQIYNQFAPGASTRTINFIGIEWGLPPNTGQNQSFFQTTLLSYVYLTAPCTQTTTQYLDIYYKMYFPQTTSIPMSANAYRQLVRDFVGVQSWSKSRSEGIMTGQLVTIFPQLLQAGQKNSLGKPVDINTSLSSTGGYIPWDPLAVGNSMNMNSISGSPSITFDARAGTATQTWTYPQGTYPGLLFGNILSGLGTNNNSMYPIVSIPIRKNSQIQNVFRRTSASNVPFLDIANLATSLGNVVPSGGWATETTPEMYFISIVTGGPVGTATYKYSKRKILNFFGNTYQYVGTPLLNFCTDPVIITTPDPIVPTLTPLVPITDYNYRISCSKALNTHTIVFVFASYVVVHDILTNTSTVYSAATYPSFAPTDITQIETDSLGNIWVACRNTGLYRINGSTIETFGVTQGLPSNSCFGVHLGQNSGSVKVWAVFDGAIVSATSADSFTTWTQYTTTSPSPFSIAGVSDGNWNTVEYIRVDPQNDNMLLVRSATTTVSPTMVGVWWSPASAATALTITTNGASPSMGDFRVHRQLLDVSPNSSFWVVIINDSNNNASYQQLTFGSSTTSVLTTTGTLEPAYISVVFEYDYVAGVDNLIVRGPVIGGYGNFSQSANLYSRPVTAIPPGGPAPATITNTAASNLRGNGSTNDQIIFQSAGNQPLTSGASPTSVYDVYAYFRVDTGLWCTTRVQSAGTPTVASTYLMVGCTLDQTTSGGPFAPTASLEYGWNGTAWVLGYSAANTTSTSPMLLENGISVAFQDGSPTTQSFVAGDVFNFAVCNGILQDNVTTMSFETIQYMKPTKTNQTDLPSTIPGSGVAITTATVQTAYSQLSSGVTVNASNQVVLTGAVGDYAAMDHAFTGNFDVTMDLSTVSIPYGTKFGLGIGTRILYGIAIDETGAQYGFWPTFDNGFMAAAGYYKTGYNGSQLQTQVSQVTSVRFVRTGYNSSTATINMYVNGTIVYTDTAAYNTDGPVYQFILRSWLNAGTATTMGAITINSADANPPMAKVGILANKTGAYDPYFFGLDYVQPSTYQTLTINGTPVATTYGSFVNAPNSGEISVDQGGWILFNSADVGKTLGGTYMYLYDPGII